jgi:hypothetical protein
VSKKADAKKPGKKDAKKQEQRASGEIKLSEHPRARHQIRLAKSWAGLLACGFAGYASWHGGAPFVDTALRALLWGISAYILVWFCAVQVWRQIAIAEVRAAEKLWREQKTRAELEARERMAQMQAEMAAR